MTKDEALRLALEALGWTDEWRPQGLKEEAITAIKAALEAKDEPVAWMVYTQEGHSAFVTDNPAVIHPSQRALPLYTTPHRTWVGLTDEEQIEMYRKHSMDGWSVFYDAIEAKLKEKNT